MKSAERIQSADSIEIVPQILENHRNRQRRYGPLTTSSLNDRC
jgi:hypothetical protein